jgi:hypothetical protein
MRPPWANQMNRPPYATAGATMVNPMSWTGLAISKASSEATEWQ